MLKDLTAYWKDKQYNMICSECGEPFIAQRPNAKYHSWNCRHKARERRRYHLSKEENRKWIGPKMERNKKIAKRWRESNRAKGICTRCGKNFTDGQSICEECQLELKA